MSAVRVQGTARRANLDGEMSVHTSHTAGETEGFGHLATFFSG